MSATAWSYNPACALLHKRFGLFPGRSPLLGESFSYFLFLGVLRCFSSPGSPPVHLHRIAALQTAGLSHSEIAGSRDICSYPALIAAYHVLLRLREPRHPPCALTYFCNDTPLESHQGNKGDAHTFSCCYTSTVLLVSICQRSMPLDDFTVSRFQHCFQLSDRKPSDCQMTSWRITDSNR